MKGALAEMKHERRREQQARRRGKPHKKEHWNIVNGVREAYSARGVYKGSRRTDDTLHNPASKRRKKEECDEQKELKKIRGHQGTALHKLAMLGKGKSNHHTMLS